MYSQKNFDAVTILMNTSVNAPATGSTCLLRATGSFGQLSPLQSSPLSDGNGLWLPSSFLCPWNTWTTSKDMSQTRPKTHT